MGIRYITALLAFAFIFTTACHSHAASLDEAVVALRVWREALVSMRVQSRISSVAETNALLAESGARTGHSEFDWIWEDSGRFRDVGWNDDRLVSRSLRMADVMRYYACGFSAAGIQSGSPSRVAIHENSPKVASMKLLKQPFWALWDDGSRSWLADRIRNVSQARVTDDGLLEIAGDEIGMEGYAVRLDPRHGYLPCAAEYATTLFSEYRVEEFREVQPGFWFPWRGSILSFAENKQMLQRWDVTSVEINVEQPSSLFAPPLADGTYVINSITGKQYWHGGKAPAHSGTAAALQPESAPANPYPLAAVPEQARNWSLWLVLAGILSVALGVWVRRRS